MQPSSLFAILVAVVSGAGEPAAPKGLEAIAPYVDELTFLVGRVDATRVPIEDVIRRLEQMTGRPAGGEPEETRRAYNQFLGLGGKEFFVLLNVAEGPQGVLGVVPLYAQADAKALADLLRDKTGLRVQRLQKVILVGTPKAVDSALSRTPKQPAELGKAFASVQGTATQLVVLPPRPFLRAQEELVPELPREFGGGPITVITKGFQWAAIGADIAPKLEVKAIAQASDEAAAAKLLKLIEASIGRVTEQAAADAPMLAQVLPSLIPKVEGDRLVLALEEKALERVLKPTLTQTREAAARAQSQNNLKQMALAIHKYHDVYKAFPPQASVAKKKPLLSWRVHILPFIEGDALYRAFKLDEPWDSPHNKALIAQMPAVYRSPLAADVRAGKTVYLAPFGPNMIFSGPKKTQMRNVLDGLSNTIMLVEADESRAVYWTQPEDLKIDRDDPLAGLLRKGAKGFNVAFGDGSVRFVSSRVDPQVLFSMFTMNQGEVPKELERD
jgi:prepilin-type processing-associated H-X9-DG protein